MKKYLPWIALAGVAYFVLFRKPKASAENSVPGIGTEGGGGGLGGLAGGGAGGQTGTTSISVGQKGKASIPLVSNVLSGISSGLNAIKTSIPLGSTIGKLFGLGGAAEPSKDWFSMDKVNDPYQEQGLFYDTYRGPSLTEGEYNPGAGVWEGNKSEFVDQWTDSGYQFASPQPTNYTEQLYESFNRQNSFDYSNSYNPAPGLYETVNQPLTGTIPSGTSGGWYDYEPATDAFEGYV